MADLNRDQISHKGKIRNKYSLAVKKQAIAYAEIHGNRPASRQFRVDERKIREWRAKKCDIEGVLVARGNKVKQRSRLCGADRKPLSTPLEEVLMEWIESRRSCGLRVSSKLIMKKARVTFNDMNQNDVTDDDFKASRGWLANFMKRNGLSLRRMIHKLVSYVIQVRLLQKKHKYSPSDIIAMDETPVWCDMASETTIDAVGKRTVSLKTTGHEKARVSVCLAAKADGTKLKSMVVFKGAKRESAALNEEFKRRAVVGH